MPRTCTICSHEHRFKIDAGLVSGRPRTDIAREFGLTESALRRHSANHLEPMVHQAASDAQREQARRLARHLHGIQRRTARALRLVLSRSDELARRQREADTPVDPVIELQTLRVLLAGIRESRANTRLLVRFLPPAPAPRPAAPPEDEARAIDALESAILQALEPYDEARAALVERLKVLEETNA